MREHYLQSVRALLDCPPAEKERLLSRLGNAITTYLEDVPEADEADLVANFGAPEDCATRLLEECTPEAVTKERQRKIFRYHIWVTILVMLLAFALGVAAYLWSNGGLIIIQSSHTIPNSLRDLPQGQVTYNYDN